MPGHRIVLLDLKTEDAETFVRAVNDSGEAFYLPIGVTGEMNVEAVSARIEAVVARPLNACRCASERIESRAQRRRRLARGLEGGWSRGTKLGWWLCSACRKPSQAVVTHWITTMLAGANDLLPQILGNGDPIDPHHRWEADGGVPNEHANANEAHMRRNEEQRAPRKRKVRRSELDRIARSGEQ